MPLLQVDDIQGIVVRGYGKMAHASFLMLSIVDAARAKRWVGKLDVKPASSSSCVSQTCTNIAVTANGLRKLGLSNEKIAMFAGEFLEGMAGSDHRRRILGDFGESDPQRWHWGGPSNLGVDVLLMCYGAERGSFEQLLADHVAALEASGLELITRLDSNRIPAKKEHFGFRDGIGQPAIEGHDTGAAAHNTVAAGEFILGYRNAYGQYTDRPLVEPSADPHDTLPQAPDDPSRRDLGLNGSYLVFRQLSQDVHGFWRYVDEKTRTATGASDASARLRLAAKMVGRWPSGAPLVKTADGDDATLGSDNDFLYYGAGDPDGLKCPIGAHVRRSNPRDALDPEPGSERSIEVGKRHRILRRGRTYGPPVSDSMDAEEILSSDAVDTPRGLHFICFNTSISRQFEFIQHTWINNPKFDGLYQDDDPVAGPRASSNAVTGGTFTIQAEPVRKRVTGMPRFVQVRGGGYFFVPGLRALRYLASLS